MLVATFGTMEIGHLQVGCKSIMETFSGVVLTFKSVNRILWCENSNETFLAVLSHGTICFSVFFSSILIFGTLESERVNIGCSDH